MWKPVYHLRYVHHPESRASHTCSQCTQQRQEGRDERERVSWFRLRLSAHSLPIEEGRWNRRGRHRLPVEERLCGCGEIQTEAHVFQQCPSRSLLLRQHYNITSFVSFMVDRSDYGTMCRCVHRTLKLYS